LTVLVPLLVIGVMVTFNALYVAAEFATVGSRRSRVQEAAEAGSTPAASLLEILQDPATLDAYVASCQIGITLSSLVAGAYGQAQLTPMLEPLFGAAGRTVAILVVLVAITSLQVVLGELLPKTAALRYPETLAMATLWPMKLSQWLFRPLVAAFNGSAFSLMRWWGLQTDHAHAHVHSPEELEGLYRDSAAGGLIDAAERDMLAGVLNVDDRLAREIMTPRRRLVTVTADTTVEDALAKVADSPHSRFPVIGDGDEITGVVHVRDLFTTSQSDASRHVAAIARPVLAVGELLTVPALWRMLRDEERHLAIVVNEYGSVAGMVTLEDALEQVLGEVHDEFDQEREPVVVEDGRVSVRGDVLIETLNHQFDLGIDPGRVDTLGGWVWQQLGRMPEVGDEVPVAGDLVVRVDGMEGRGVGWASFQLPGGGTR